ncbi:hypothetical protein J6590_074946 [Homalodisca vitripennis]|nr:hypothetical protein J6590_074946 [Homalodisca vitripennis]
MQQRARRGRQPPLDTVPRGSRVARVRKPVPVSQHCLFRAHFRRPPIRSSRFLILVLFSAPRHICFQEYVLSQSSTDCHEFQVNETAAWSEPAHVSSTTGDFREESKTCAISNSDSKSNVLDHSAIGSPDVDTRPHRPADCTTNSSRFNMRIPTIANGIIPHFWTMFGDQTVLRG